MADKRMVLLVYAPARGTGACVFGPWREGSPAHLRFDAKLNEFLRAAAKRGLSVGRVNRVVVMNARAVPTTLEFAREAIRDAEWWGLSPERVTQRRDELGAAFERWVRG